MTWFKRKPEKVYPDKVWCELTHDGPAIKIYKVHMTEAIAKGLRTNVDRKRLIRK
jgi:hypothetical protein